MLTVLVPYRDREEHLKQFLANMSGWKDTKIFVIEQADDKPFNRGKLLNIGFANRPEGTTHVALHDVDMLPGADADYSFPPVPTHICSTPLYPTFFGAVTLFGVSDFIKCNGFDNEYWGWGAEDDDLYRRVMFHIGRFERRHCSFTVLPHERNIDAKLYEKNCERLTKSTAPSKEGLTTLVYEMLAKVTLQDYILLKVKV